MAKIKKAKVNGKIVDVVSIEEYVSHRDAYDPSYTAIEYQDDILPIITQSDQKYGVTVPRNMPMVLARKPEGAEHYNQEFVIDFSDVDSMKSLIEKQETIRKLENEILTTVDNVTRFKISTDDTPEMAGLKTAVNNKSIDLDKYEPRFANNYNNDKRLFNKNTISLPMLKRMCTALDIKSTLILEDAYDGVPNPMGEPVVITLTGGDSEDGQ